MRNTWNRLILLPLLAALSLALLACGGDDNSGQGGADQGTVVNVTEKDFSISPAESSAAAGTLTFKVKNDGPSTHEFVVIRTNLDPASLPQENGVVSEETPGLEVIDEVEEVKSGKTANLSLDLESGQYVLICNISGHYQLGMYTAFTVQ